MLERRKRKLVGVLKNVSRASVDRSGQSRRPTTRDLQQQGARTPPPPSSAWPACCPSCDGSCEGTLHVQLPGAPVPEPGLASGSRRYTASSLLQLLPQAIRARTEIEAGAALVNLFARVQGASGANGVNMLISSWSETSTWRTVRCWCCLETQ